MKRLLLLGAGLAHLGVLRAFASARVAAAEVTVVAPGASWFCTPMLAGCVAGRYRADDCMLPLAPLVDGAGARLVEAPIESLDAVTRRVVLADGRVLPYDVLSLDGSPAIDRDAIPGARAHALFVQPAEPFVILLERLLALAATRSLDVVVVGGDARAVEIAFALEQRIGSGETGARIALVAGPGGPLAGASASLVARVVERLAARRITLVRDDCAAIDAQAVHLQRGARLACDAPIVAIAAAAPGWLRTSGLALTASGQVDTRTSLQSRSHPAVFAAPPAAPPGAGEMLAENLRRAVGGGTLVERTLRGRALQLIAEGDRRAIAAWHRFAAEGRWVGRWKERRDREALARHLTRSA